MGIMYVVSPDFLLPFEEQSANYTFNIKGFRLFVNDPDSPNVLSAKSELYKSNINDIIGFVILVDDLSYYIDEINEFLTSVDSFCKGHSRRVVIGTMINKGDKAFSELVYVENIELFRVTNINILTDHIVKHELFGTVIKGKTPYKFMLKNSDNLHYVDIPRLKYTPIFSNRLLSVLSSTIIISDDFDKVLAFDAVYSKFIEEGERILAFIRKLKISKDMRIPLDKDDYIDILQDIEESDNRLLYISLIKECGGFYEQTT